MSNFLDNLASRSLKLVPVVQPRLASRFEPPTLAGRFPSAPPVEAAEAERSTEGEATNAWPEARQPETRVIESSRPVPISPPDASRQEPAGSIGQAATPQQSPPRPAAAHVPVLPIETRAQIAQTQTAAAAPHAKPQASPLTKRAQPEEAVSSGAVKSEAEAALENRIRRLMAGRFNARAGEEATRGARAAPAPSAQRERDARESPENTQTIRVTIGRIDVRAVAAPAPQESRRTSTRPAPQLSLADYLKQRGGGRR